MEDIKLVKNLAFGEYARGQVLTGVEKLTNAVSSTLGASGKCVIIEDNKGNPQITKDGVTVANSITLRDPLENIGAFAGLVPTGMLPTRPHLGRGLDGI